MFSFVEDTSLNLAPQPLYSLARKSLMIFYTTMKNAQIEYILELDGPGPVLLIDENKIRQVFVHLIRNSLEAMPDGGTLRIAATEDDHRVTVSITDSGTGIAADTLPRVKDPFFTTKTYGNGIGLALVEQTVQAHGGIFSIHDGPGGGTQATVTLPKILPASERNQAA